jgi:hypothetical protein
MRKAYKLLIGKHEMKKPLKKRRRGWDANIKMCLRYEEIACEIWIHLAQDRV